MTKEMFWKWFDTDFNSVAVVEYNDLIEKEIDFFFGSK
jgi:hypothetical protein